MSLEYQVVRNVEEFRALKDDWTRLLERSRIASPFLSWSWMFTWWQRYCDGKRDRSLAIVTARRGAELVAILPGYVRKGRGLTTFALLGTEFESTDYLRTIEDRELSTSLTSSLLSHVLQAGPPIDVVELLNVLSTDPFVSELQSYAHAAGASVEVEHHRVCPFIDLSAFADWEKFLASRSSNMRWKVRRCMRRLADAGAEFDWVRDPALVRAAVGELFELHAQRFDAKQAESIFRAAVRQPFHEDVSTLFHDQGVLRLFRIRVDGKTIAALYCFQFGDGLYYFQAGSDPKWEDHSVGLVVIGHAIRYGFEHRLAMFDFMRGAEPYKFRWTDTTRKLVVIRVGVSVKGRIALALRRGTVAVKRMVKRYTRRVPEAVPAGGAAAS